MSPRAREPREAHHLDRMRVLIVQPWIRVGGAELLSLRLADELERAGHHVPIAALFVDAEGLPPALVARTYHLPPRALQALFRRSRRLALVLGPAALLAVIVRASRGADCLNPHNLPAPVLAAAVARLRGIPIVWQANEVPEPARGSDAMGPLERAAWRVGAALARWSAHAPAAIIVLSEHTAAAVRARYGREPVVLRPGVEGCDGLGTDAPAGGARLLFVGKLHPQKDPLRAIRVAAALVARGLDARLVMVGGGPLRDTVAAAARAALPGRATILTRVGDAELRRLYRDSDVLLVTADARQSWGLTPFEALACGTPAVISAGIGAAEVLGPVEAALIAAPTDEALTDAAERLVRDPALRQRLVRNGAALVRELTWRRFAEGCLAVFERACA